jgi:hypothetical protein
VSGVVRGLRTLRTERCFSRAFGIGPQKPDLLRERIVLGRGRELSAYVLISLPVAKTPASLLCKQTRFDKVFSQVYLYMIQIGHEWLR